MQINPTCALEDTGTNERKTKRSKAKYPGLNKGVNGKFRQDLIDYDYIDDLTEEQKQWLSNFSEEYLSGNKNHPGEMLNKTDQEWRDSYNRNNSNRRDIMNHQKAKGLLVGVEENLTQIEKSNITNVENQEDWAIALIDKGGDDKDL